jgi:hypothetical protein
LNYYLLLKTGKLLAGALALVLITGLGNQAIAESPLDNADDPPTQAQMVIIQSTTINFDSFVNNGGGNGELTGNEFLGQGVVFSTPDLALNIGFDSFVNNGGGNGELTGNEFLGQGVVFSTPDLALNIGGTPASGSQPNSLGADLQVNDFQGSLVIEFTRNQCATDVQFLIFNPPFSATAFDIFGNSLGTLNSSGPFDEVFSFAGLPVHKVVTAAQPDQYAIDDFSFTLQRNCGQAVGGEMIPLDATMILVAGTHTAAAWMIPVIISAIGIGIVIARKF